MAAARPLPCWEMITINGALALDFVGRYESLQSNFIEAMRRIGAPAPMLPKAKAARRPAGHYRDYYDDVSRQKVPDAYAPEIEAFAYRF